MMAHPFRLIGVAIGFLLAECPTLARGDVFVLSQGGQVVGQLQNAERSPRDDYVIKTPEGILLTLTQSQVKQVQRPKPEDLEYDKIRTRYPDTVQGQWELAEWCKEQKMLAQRKSHLERVVEIDPDHEAAHKALGHTKIDGKWTTQRDFVASQGMRFYRGKLRTEQEIKIIEDEQKSKTTEKEWAQKIDRLIGALAGDRAEEARDALLKIRDPKAAKALAAAMKRNPHPEVRIVMAQALAGLARNDVLLFLAERAIEDPVEEVRMACLDLLKKAKNPEVVAYFVDRLKDRDNAAINRAAAGLRLMNDPSAVVPLIDHLVTAHRIKIPGSNPGQMSTTFGSGGGGMAMGGGPQFKTVLVRNPEVLDALTAITGQAGFQYDVAAWRKWFAAQRKREAPDIRRDK